eukprot:6101210-Ditylum_brightwellii.AAC.1
MFCNIIARLWRNYKKPWDVEEQAQKLFKAEFPLILKDVLVCDLDEDGNTLMHYAAYFESYHVMTAIFQLCGTFQHTES